MIILISDKVDHRTINSTRDRVGKFIKITGSIFQKALIILKVFVLNIGDSKYMKQKLIKLETDKSIIIVRDFNIPFSMIDKQKIKYQYSYIILNKNINQLNQVYIYRILSSNSKMHILFKCI